MEGSVRATRGKTNTGKTHLLPGVEPLGGHPEGHAQHRGAAIGLGQLLGDDPVDAFDDVRVGRVPAHHQRRQRTQTGLPQNVEQKNPHNQLQSRPMKITVANSENSERKNTFPKKWRRRNWGLTPQGPHRNIWSNRQV